MMSKIRDTLEKATMDERVNGELGVRVIIQKQSGANTVDIVHEVQKRLPAIAASLPGDVDIELIYEGSQEITDAISSLSETIMYAFIFVVLVVMVFLANLIICNTANPVRRTLLVNLKTDIIENIGRITKS